MSTHHEEIARLTGRLVFNVDSAGFQRFNAMMKRASQQMAKLGADYTKMANQMAKGLKLKIDTTAIDKAKTKLDHAMSREAKAAKALTDQKRTTFQAELANQKLVFAGEKQKANLVSQAVKDQQSAAIIAAKNFAAQQRTNGITKQQLASQNALVASQTKQARLQQIVAKTHAITQKADAAHLLTQTKSQQIQTVAARIAATAQQQAIVHHARMQSLQAAAAAKQTAVDQRNQKFQWAQQKQQVWAANQAARAANASNGHGGGISSMLHGGIGGISMGIAEALGPVGLAIAALTAVVGAVGHAISERVEKRQESTADTQQFDNALDNSSSNPADRAKFKAAYVHDYQEYGMNIDKESARTYSNGVQGLTQKGYTPDEAIKVMRDRSAMFRAGNLNASQQESINLQLGQVLAKGKAQGDDFKPIHVAVGANIANMMDIGAARYLGFKGKDKAASGFMLQAQKAGTITPRALDAGIAYAVEHSKEALERHKGSIDAREARLKNDLYLQTAKQQEDPALVGSINDRIEAERKLTEAMAPVNKMFEELDKSLTNFDTGIINLTSKFLNLMSGKKPDGSEAPNAMHKDDNPRPGSVGAALGPRLKPDTNQEPLDSNAGLMGKIMHFLGAKPTADDDSDVSNWKGFDPNNIIQKDGIQQMAELYNRYQSPATSIPTTITGGTLSGGTQVNAPVTVEGSNIHIELHGSATEEDRQKMMTAVTAELDKRTTAMTMQIPELTNDAIRNLMLGPARAGQAQK